MPYYFNTAERAPLERRPGVNLRTAWMENLLLSQVELDPNAEVPAHQHPEEQVTIVVRGEITMTIGGETRLYKVGDSCLIPSDVAHGVVAGAEGATMFDVFTPLRKDLQY